MSINTPAALAQWIKMRSREMGFDGCGISRAGCLDEEKERLERWITGGMHGEMGYMERNGEKRLDPQQLVEGAQTVISFIYNYFPADTLPAEDNFIISKYAYGKDYHLVIRERLYQLISELREKAGECRARAFTDSAPVLERAWARRSGLGWIGKNTCLIHPKLGSFFFLAEIITDLEIEPDHTTINDLCGGCTRCIDACPTSAIVSPRVLDARKCISYLTIEYRGELQDDMQKDFGQMIFGCDICQDVCPWNRFSQPHAEPRFEPGEDLRGMDRRQWRDLTKDEFDEMFQDSAMQRTGYEGLKRNIDFVGGTLSGL